MDLLSCHPYWPIKDGLPFIGEHPAAPHTWFALGYGGNGITYSLIAAELFRDRLTEGISRDPDLYGFDRETSVASHVLAG